MWKIADENYLCHHGIKGQKWGVRRFQNEDGTYTAAGRERYSIKDSANIKEKNKKTLLEFEKKSNESFTEMFKTFETENDPSKLNNDKFNNFLKPLGNEETAFDVIYSMNDDQLDTIFPKFVEKMKDTNTHYQNYLKKANEMYKKYGKGVFDENGMPKIKPYYKDFKGRDYTDIRSGAYDKVFEGDTLYEYVENYYKRSK